MCAKTQEQITKNMKKVKSRDSKIEILLRKELWKRGLRYQKNVNEIFGKPDIVFRGNESQFFVIVNFGMVLIGKNVKKILKHIKSFGFLKLKEI